jgi:hypothetical protein
VPERLCEACKHWRPYEASIKLRVTYAKCASPRRDTTVVHHEGKFVMPVFAETCRGIPSLCGPSGVWWERKVPTFEVIDEDRDLNWDDEDGDDET